MVFGFSKCQTVVAISLPISLVLLAAYPAAPLADVLVDDADTQGLQLLQRKASKVLNKSAVDDVTPQMVQFENQITKVLAATNVTTQQCMSPYAACCYVQPFVTGFGWYGMSALLLGYILVSSGKADGEALWFQLLNISGSTGVGSVCFCQQAWPGLGLEVAWSVIAVFFIVKAIYVKQAPVSSCGDDGAPEIAG